MERCLFNICWYHTQLCNCYFTIWQELGWPSRQMLKSKIRVSVRKTQRLQTKAGWNSQWNVQQFRSPIAFEFETIALYSSHQLEHYYHAYKLGHKDLKFTSDKTFFSIRFRLYHDFIWQNQCYRLWEYFGNRLIIRRLEIGQNRFENYRFKRWLPFLFVLRIDSYQKFRNTRTKNW